MNNKVYSIYGEIHHVDMMMFFPCVDEMPDLVRLSITMSEKKGLWDIQVDSTNATSIRKLYDQIQNLLSNGHTNLNA